MRMNQQPKNSATTVWIITAFLCLLCCAPLRAASFDCQQAGTLVEKTVCSTPELSSLDEELANIYAQALRTITDKQALIADQRAWLKTRDTCEKIEWDPGKCLLYQYRKRNIEMQSLLDAPAEQSATIPARPGTAKGEFVLARVDDTTTRFCQDYTRNLNEFRHLDFTQPNPRLSAKHPQFSRPHWEEVALNLKIAEHVILSESGHPLWEKVNGGLQAWTDWLKWTEPLRASGKVRLWQTRIDIDGDGSLDTLVRLYPIVRHEDETKIRKGPHMSWMAEPGIICLLAGPHTPEDAVKEFNREAVYDIIYDHASNAYYTVTLNMNGSAEYLYTGYSTGSSPGAASGLTLQSLFVSYRMGARGVYGNYFMKKECIIDFSK